MANEGRFCGLPSDPSFCLNVSEIAPNVCDFFYWNESYGIVVPIGLLFMLVAFLFKISAVPFHM